MLLLLVPAGHAAESIVDQSCATAFARSHSLFFLLGLFRTITEEHRYYAGDATRRTPHVARHTSHVTHHRAVLSGSVLIFYDRPVTIESSLSSSSSSSAAAAAAASATSAPVSASASASASAYPVMTLSCDGCFVKSGHEPATLLLLTQPR
jgi:hypothetical protein